MKTWLLPFFACAAALLAAEQGSPDVIRWEEEKKEIKVEETGRLEVFDKKPGPSGTDRFADRVADPGKRFLWVPSPDPGRGAGGARIPDAVLSEDRSALLLLETVGAADGPFDTRLVVIALQSGEIVRVTRFHKAHYIKLLPIPESDDILLFAAPEKGRQRLVRVDPIKGTQRAAVNTKEISDAVFLAGQLLLKHRAAGGISCHAPETLLRENLRKTAAPGGFLIPESGTVVNNFIPGDPAKIERIRLDGEKFHADERFLSLPKGAHPTCGMTFGESGNPMQLYLEPGGPALLRIGNRFHPLTGRSSGMAAYHQPGKTLFLGLQKQDMIAEFRPAESTNMLRSSLTGQRSPRTRGEIMRIFCENGNPAAALILDHRANVYRLQLPGKGRSWPKKLVFVPGE